MQVQKIELTIGRHLVELRDQEDRLVHRQELVVTHQQSASVQEPDIVRMERELDPEVLRHMEGLGFLGRDVADSVGERKLDGANATYHLLVQPGGDRIEKVGRHRALW